MPRFRRDRWRLSGVTVRRTAAILATIAVLAGVLFGAAAAASSDGPSPAGAGARLPLLARLEALAPPQPLHRLVIDRLQGRNAPGSRQRARIFVGRYVRATADGAIITARGRTVEVRVTSETRLPVRRPQPGDRVLVVGQGAAGGTVQARAVFVRRGGPAAWALL